MTEAYDILKSYGEPEFEVSKVTKILNEITNPNMNLKPQVGICSRLETLSNYISYTKAEV